MREPSLATKIWCFPIWIVWKCFKECRNVWGYLNGHGGCVCCGDRWNWKARHNTRYVVKIPGASVIRGIAPLCEECWQLVTPFERVEFHRDHCAHQGELGKPYTTAEWKAIREALEKE